MGKENKDTDDGKSQKKNVKKMQPLKSNQSSRGQQLLSRVIQSQEHSAVSSALSWGVSILYLDEILAHVERLEKQPMQKGIKVNCASQSIKVVTLKRPYLKIEDQSRKFRPIKYTFLNFPEFSFTSPNKSLFTLDQPQCNPHKDGNPGEQEEEHNQKPIMRRRRRGYCECCLEMYSEFSEHLVSERHQRFALDPSHYLLINDLATPLICDLLEWPCGYGLSTSWNTEQGVGMEQRMVCSENAVKVPGSLQTIANCEVAEKICVKSEEVGWTKELLACGREQLNAKSKLDRGDTASQSLCSLDQILSVEELSGAVYRVPTVQPTADRSDPPLLKLPAVGISDTKYQVSIENPGTMNQALPVNEPLGRVDSKQPVQEMSHHVDQLELLEKTANPLEMVPPVHGILGSGDHLLHKEKVMGSESCVHFDEHVYHVLPMEDTVCQIHNDLLWKDGLGNCDKSPMADVQLHKNLPLYAIDTINSLLPLRQVPVKSQPSLCFEGVSEGKENVPIIHKLSDKTANILLGNVSGTQLGSLASVVTCDNFSFTDTTAKNPSLCNSFTKPTYAASSPKSNSLVFPSYSGTDNHLSLGTNQVCASGKQNSNKRKPCESPKHPPAKKQLGISRHPLYTPLTLSSWFLCKFPDYKQQPIVPVLADWGSWDLKMATSAQNPSPPKISLDIVSSESDWDAHLPSQPQENPKCLQDYRDLKTVQVHFEESWYGKHLCSVLAHDL